MMVVGEGANAHTGSLSLMLDSQPELAQLVKSAVWTGGRRWDVLLHNGIRVKLPEDTANYSAKQAWSQLAKLQSGHQLLSREVNVVDLRVKGRAFLRVSETGQAAMEKPRWSL